MTFMSMLSGFIGRSIDVTVIGDTTFFGTLTAVAADIIRVKEPSGVYGPGRLLLIPTANIDHVVIPH